MRLVFFPLLAAACAPAAAPTQETEILWDEWGVPHIFAPDDEELARAFGWAQMHAHGDAILRLYGLARGRAAEYWGEEYLDSDRLVRSVGITGRAPDLYDAQSTAFRRWLDAFADGMNAYTREHPDRIAEDVRAVLPVEPADPLRHGQRQLFAFVAFGGDRPPIVGPDRMLVGAAPGSNTWAIGPSRSASGNAMLLQNPHLPWDEPFMRFFEAQLEAPGLHVYGATLIGLPVVAIGLNEHLGWSHTVNTVDVLDSYRLRLEGDGYRFDGEVRPFDVEEEMLRVRQPDGTLRDEWMVIRRSVHGPVISVSDDTTAIAIRSPALERAGAYEQWLDMARAGSLDEFEAALRRMELPMFTTSYADADGHIFYLFGGQIPVRPHGDFAYWQRTVPGDTSATLWTGIHDYDDLPRIVDPPGGFVQNSNSPPWFATVPSPLDPADYPPYFAPDYLLFREKRALELLLSEDRIGFDRLVEMRHSTRMLLADRVLDELIEAAAASDSPRAADAARVLEAWDRRALPESRGAVLFMLWAQQQCRGGTPVNPCDLAVPWSRDAPLETPPDLADPGRAVALLDGVAATMTERFGALDVAWGDVMRLGPDLPGRGAPGALGVFQVMHYAPAAAGAFRPVSGDTWVAVIEFTREGPRGKVLLAYGNASQPGSPHDADQLALLARGEMRPLRFGRQAAADQP